MVPVISYLNQDRDATSSGKCCSEYMQKRSLFKCESQGFRNPSLKFNVINLVSFPACTPLLENIKLYFSAVQYISIQTDGVRAHRDLHIHMVRIIRLQSDPLNSYSLNSSFLLNSSLPSETIIHQLTPHVNFSP